MTILKKIPFAFGSIVLGLALMVASAGKSQDESSSRSLALQGSPTQMSRAAEYGGAHGARPTLLALSSEASGPVPFSLDRVSVLDRKSVPEPEAREHFATAMDRIERTVASVIEFGDPAPEDHERNRVIEDAVFAYMGIADHLGEHARAEHYRRMRSALASLKALDSDD